MKIKAFLIKLFLFSVLLSSTYFFALWQLSQGQVDFFYSKFTHKAGSLLVGSSRVLYGIVPSIIEQNFDENEIEYPVLNFGFAREISDYGPIYLDAIEKKIKPGTKKGIFILGVNPGSLASPKSQPDSISTILKDQTFLSELNQFNKNPNFEYVRKVYTHSLYKGFNKSRRLDLIRYSHPDGWLEVVEDYETYSVSQHEIEKWTKMNVESISHQTKGFKPSTARLLYLEKTISYLQECGNVYLVRIPMHKSLLQVEQSFWPDFDTKITEIASKFQIPYFNYSIQGEQFSNFDGSHLFGHGAKNLTQKLCDDIKEYRNEK